MEGYGSVQIMTDPDPGGPKTYESRILRIRTTTLQKIVKNFRAEASTMRRRNCRVWILTTWRTGSGWELRAWTRASWTRMWVAMRTGTSPASSHRSSLGQSQGKIHLFSLFWFWWQLRKSEIHSTVAMICSSSLTASLSKKNPSAIFVKNKHFNFWMTFVNLDW